MTSFAIVAIVLLGLFTPVLAQDSDDPASRLLERMSPRARVGQLFVVTFPGTDADELSAIYQLITEGRIGGVLLRAENGNIDNQGDTLFQVATMTNDLQQLARAASQESLETESGDQVLSPYVPLLVGLEQERYSAPSPAAISGTTPLPSPMAIGATWNPAHAQSAGDILGRELAALGINLLLGPSLDVLDTPQPGNTADLGTRSFGGDPYWVGRMGKAYIQGIHVGSQGRVAVMPGHFPGLGAANRPLSEEVSTIQKSLEQLKQIELAPFFAAANATDPLSRPDGLLVSHIRYRGFQGNIYASTKPISFDPQALQQLMSLPELATWREAGGVTIADELGVRAVRRFYDPTEQEFNGLRIAREAFFAGNDLLVLSHFALTDDWEAHFTNVRATLSFFEQRYELDPTFQAQVDEAVLRILRMKLRLYGGTFVPSAAQVDASAAAEEIGHSVEQVAPIARNAVTLLSPPSPELRPPPPAAEELITIFTDDRQIVPCPDCQPVYAIPPTLLQDTLIRLYGPGATRQILPYRVASFSFTEMMDYLNSPLGPAEELTPPAPHRVDIALQQSDWVLFAMMDTSSQDSQLGAVRRFLAQQADLLRDKKVVVFAFGAPYYLDTTEIAKLSAYFGLYDHSEPFLETAARALFDEFAFVGASPVSVPGINYSLIAQTQPDATQVIQVLVGEDDGGQMEPLQVYQGDSLQLRTSVILDRNGHPVPDGTPVEFIFTYPQEGLEHTVAVTSRDGVAVTTVTLDRIGQLQVSVRAEPVPRAVRLQLEIREGEAAVVISITPTPSPVPLVPTASPSPLPTAVATPTAELDPGSGNGRPSTQMGWLDLAQGFGVTALFALAGYVSLWWRRRDLSLALRGALWCSLGGLAAYIGLAIQFPTNEWLQDRGGPWISGTVTLVGSALSWMIVVASDVLVGGPSSTS